MPTIEPTTSEVPVITDGTYEVVCLDVEEKHVEDDAYGKRDKLVFRLRLVDQLDEDGNEILFAPQINRAWGSDKSNLYKYAIGFGLEANLYAPINTDLFKGKKAQAFIFTEEEGKYPKITALIPVKAAKVNSKTAAADEPTPKTAGPALVNFMGGINWTKFWAEVDAMKVSHEQVAEAVNGDLRNLETMDVSTVVDLLDHLRTKTAAAS